MVFKTLFITQLLSKDPDYDVYFATNLIIKNQEGKLSKGSNTYFLSKEKIQNNLCTIHPKIFENATKADVENPYCILKIYWGRFDDFRNEANFRKDIQEL